MCVFIAMAQTDLRMANSLATCDPIVKYVHDEKMTMPSIYQYHYTLVTPHLHRADTLKTLTTKLCLHLLLPPPSSFPPATLSPPSLQLLSMLRGSLACPFHDLVSLPPQWLSWFSSCIYSFIPAPTTTSRVTGPPQIPNDSFRSWPDTGMESLTPRSRHA